MLGVARLAAARTRVHMGIQRCFSAAADWPVGQQQTVASRTSVTGTQLDRNHDVFHITPEGVKTKKLVLMSDVLFRFGVHARDVISLGLQGRYSPPPAILPRGNVLIVALGNFKLLIYSDSCTVFEANRPVVDTASDELAELVQLNHSTLTSNGGGKHRIYGEPVLHSQFRTQKGKYRQASVHQVTRNGRIITQDEKGWVG